MHWYTVGSATKKLKLVQDSVHLGNRSRSMTFMRLTDTEPTEFDTPDLARLIEHGLPQLMELFEGQFTISRL